MRVRHLDPEERVGRGALWRGSIALASPGALQLSRSALQFVGHPEVPRGSRRNVRSFSPSISHETGLQPYFSGRIFRNAARHHSNLFSNSRSIFDTSSAINSMSPSFRSDHTILSFQCFGFSPSGGIARVL